VTLVVHPVSQRYSPGTSERAQQAISGISMTFGWEQVPIEASKSLYNYGFAGNGR
jgi:hypothetical protein